MGGGAVCPGILDVWDERWWGGRDYCVCVQQGQFGSGVAIEWIPRMVCWEDFLSDVLGEDFVCGCILEDCAVSVDEWVGVIHAETFVADDDCLAGLVDGDERAVSALFLL